MRRLLTIFTFVLGFAFATSATAQPRFAVELAAGQNVGFVPYVDNVVVLQGGRPVLVDELPGNGATFDLRFVFSNWVVGGNVRLFDRDTIVIHHRGTEDLPPNRVRPDGSIDDTGVEYEPVERVRSASPMARPGDLLAVDLGTGYRLYAIDGPFTLYFPFSLGVVGVKVLEVNQPTILGLLAAVGTAASYSVAPPFGVFLSAQVHGMVTPAYRTAADTARTSYTAGESTLEAVLGATAFGSVMLGIEFRVR